MKKIKKFQACTRCIYYGGQHESIAGFEYCNLTSGLTGEFCPMFFERVKAIKILEKMRG